MPRILCLGGSTTEGGGVGHECVKAWPCMLGQILEQETGRAFEVMNAGVSGWTTAETVAAWFLLLKDYRPDLVVIHHAVNDSEPRTYPTFRTDYTHFRRVWELPDPGALERRLIAWSDFYAWLAARRGPPTLGDAVTRERGGPPRLESGRLPAGTEGAYRRNVLSVALDARRTGARVLLATIPFDLDLEERDERSTRSWRAGLREHNQILRELAAEHGFLLADLEGRSREQPERLGPHFTDLVHVDVEGKLIKASWVGLVLRDGWLPELAR